MTRSTSIRIVENSLSVLIRSVLIICALALALTPSISFAQKTTPTQSRLSEFSEKYLTSRPITLEKSDVVVSAKTSDYLKSNLSKNATAKFWVFFSDKGATAAAQLQSDPSEFAVLKKSIKRRAKTGLNKIVFADLPVERNYISTIERLGAKNIRSSRWLNAAVFSITPQPEDSQAEISLLLNTVAELPFVIEIKPALTFTRKPEPEAASDIQENSQSPNRAPFQNAGDQLNYGLSVQQITQIKAEVGHQRGYKGQGVTIAMLDTGYRTSHQAFALAFIEGRVLGQYDFINNDANTSNEFGDPGSQWFHGTLTWSTAGGQVDGILYGPAYGANFLLAKTENVVLEHIQEEFDWVAAMEWADSLGADVISSSLGYIDWYTFADLDGATAVTTIGANLAAGLGIVVCDAMGNSGSSAGSLIAPADAHDILSIGAVDFNGFVASFSSRGPTADGRIKPDVSARGVSTRCASSNGDVSYTFASGTSLSTPLAAGAAAQLISAKPNFPPLLIIQALKETASQALSPDNNIGWGIIDVEKALDWGVNFTANGSPTSIFLEDLPASVTFSDNSDIPATGWAWDFGDSQGSTVASSVSHNYDTAGVYNVGLTIQTSFGAFSKTTAGLVLITADTLEFISDSAYAGSSLAISVTLTNTQPLQSIEIPFSFADPLIASYDSATLGSRTVSFLTPVQTSIDPFNKTSSLRITTTGAALLPGAGEIMKLHFTLETLALGGINGAVDSATISGSPLLLSAPTASYPPRFTPAVISTKFTTRGDANNDTAINIADVTYLIARIFTGGAAPVTVHSGDANSDFKIRIDDVTFLIAFIFTGGPPPATP